MDEMNDNNTTQSRLSMIGNMLQQIRINDGKYQDDYEDYGVTRRQIQRGEMGSNLTLMSLFTLIDNYEYTLDEFFREME